MRQRWKRLLLTVLTVAGAIAAAPTLVWISLTHKPSFYKAIVVVPREQREARAKKFVSHSLQLRNDIANEPTWEAVFSDEEVNAWLAEDLVAQFADQLPPEVHEPRVMFELDRLTLAFELDQGPLRSVIWVVARPRVPEPNVLELTFEKIRAGVVPVPPDQVFDRIVERAQSHGLDVSWKREGGAPVATIRYAPLDGRDDIKLERVQVFKGEMRLAGRSDKSRGEVRAMVLPTRKVLQSKFPLPRRKVQPKDGVSFAPTLEPSKFPVRSSTAHPTS